MMYRPMAEAEYTYRLRKRTIPLRLQPNYNPDGWLGALAGSKLVFDCSIPPKFDEAVRNLIRELGNVGKVGSKSTISLSGFDNSFSQKFICLQSHRLQLMS